MKHCDYSCQTLDHLVDDENADILIGPHGFIAGTVDGGTEGGVPQAIEIHSLRCAAAGLGTGGLGAVRHNHEADGSWHGGPRHRF